MRQFAVFFSEKRKNGGKWGIATIGCAIGNVGCWCFYGKSCTFITGYK